MQFSIVSGDTLPHLIVSLIQNDQPLDVTDSTIVFKMRADDTCINDDVTLGGTCVIDSAVSGSVHYAWNSTDTANPGTYHGQFHITYVSGDKLTVPSSGSIAIIVTPRIGN